MGFKSHNTGFIIRIFLLVVVVFGTGSTLVLAFEKELFFIPLLMFLVLALQVSEFLWYMKRINRPLITMLESLRNADIITKFDTRAGTSWKGSYKAFNEVADYIMSLRIEKEAQYGYLQAIISHIRIGIITLKGIRDIEFINNPALEILGVEKPESWEELSSMVPEFTGAINDIAGKASRLIELKSETGVKKLSVNVSTTIILNEEFRIITFQDIRSEIEKKESEAWQKLIRILRHEIMNSVTPISSMTETILMLVEGQPGKSRKISDMTDEDIRDIRESITTIHDRSEGLNEFLEQYREVTKIPEVKKSAVKVSLLLERSLRLLDADLSAQGVRTSVKHADPELKINADPHLIEQVLINIIKNSIEALHHTTEKRIDIKTFGSKQSQTVTVTDNGCGIPEKVLDEIFVPFYSTKEEGSGIGLSLSRQIMHLHGGDIFASSLPGKQTTFSLVFNA